MDLGDLRPEFVEQVIQFKKSVLERIQPKKLNGNLIDGAILTELIKNYVSAINEGAIPNIENTWQRICRTECQNRSSEALKFYENLLKDNVYKRVPLAESELKVSKTCVYLCF